MATFERAPVEVSEMALELVDQFHPELATVKIDYIFAYGEYDEVTGEQLSPALKRNGHRALGITRKLPLKDRAMGRGDAEILLDGDWWESATDKERRALLDHELTHIVMTADTDDLERPKLKLRPHDYEVGWFRQVAQRHGVHSQECKQMTIIVEESGQFLMPGIAGEQTRTQRLEVASR